jgi:hypothetical protein
MLLSSETTWSATDVPIPMFGEQLHKFAHYFPVYDAVFARYRDRRPVRMLEIGVDRGGSLLLWRKYFRQDAVIVGIDCLPQCAQFDDPSNNIFVRIGDQRDTVFLQTVADELGPFDIILDDASHIPAYTLSAFEHMFVNGLADGGVYLVEDLFTCYIDQQPFAHYSVSDFSPQFVEVVKYLIDLMHAHYTQMADGTGAQMAAAFSPDGRGELRVPLATTLVESVWVHDSIVAVFRGPRTMPCIVRT